MKISEVKERVHRNVDKIEEPALLYELDTIITEMVEHDTKTDWWDDLTPSQQAEIKQAQQDARNGKGMPNEQVQNETLRWLENR